MDARQLKDFVKYGVFRMELVASYSPYQAIVSTGQSGLSFGAMQNDVGDSAHNATAQAAFEQIMNLQVQSHALTQSAAQQLISAAEHNPHGLTQAQLSTISAALAAHRDIVDATDNARFEVVWGYLAAPLQAATANAAGPGALNSVAPDPLLLIDLAEWGNRTRPPGLTQSANFLQTAPEISLQYYDANYLSHAAQFTSVGESFATWQQRVIDARDYALSRIGATVTYYHASSGHNMSVGVSDANVGGANYFSLYAEPQQHQMTGVLWKLNGPTTEVGAGAIQVAMGSQVFGTLAKGNWSGVAIVNGVLQITAHDSTLQLPDNLNMLVKVIGDRNTITAGSHDFIAVQGDGTRILAGDSTSVTYTGKDADVKAGKGGSVIINGAEAKISAGDQEMIFVTGDKALIQGGRG